MYISKKHVVTVISQKTIWLSGSHHNYIISEETFTVSLMENQIVVWVQRA